MWIVIEYIFLAAIVLVAITEFFIPLLTGRPYFGSFRKLKNNAPKTYVEPSLEDKMKQAKQKVDEVKVVQQEVTENYKTAEQLKEESDNLLS